CGCEVSGCAVCTWIRAASVSPGGQGRMGAAGRGPGANRGNTRFYGAFAPGGAPWRGAGPGLAKGMGTTGPWGDSFGEPH
ncbi:MAG: hypothetical protein AVDCRST_MAG68-663, partial [uncultured Gemmatimonadetes bacterium]